MWIKLHVGFIVVWLHPSTGEQPQKASDIVDIVDSNDIDDFDDSDTFAAMFPRRRMEIGIRFDRYK